MHNNIRILNNSFITAGNAVLSVRSTKDLTFSNNIIQASATVSKPAFKLTVCNKINIQHYQFVNSNPVVTTIGMASKSFETDIKEINVN